ncbi:MAG: VWA domain-containing protein [Euryarchaeota archaeon]|nr:VWA domain-containing protein [Euryarchaeota archaeon]
MNPDDDTKNQQSKRLTWKLIVIALIVVLIIAIFLVSTYPHSPANIVTKSLNNDRSEYVFGEYELAVSPAAYPGDGAAFAPSYVGYESGLALGQNSADFSGFNNFDFFNTEEYNKITERGFVSPLVEPLSTFASSVDTASYSLVRAKLSKGEPVSPDMVRIEEFINYFKYDYPEPTGGAPLAISAELGYAPWAKDHLLLHIGVQAEEVDMSNAPPANLVFLIDVSGSMQSADKLGLVRQSFMLLTQTLRDTDRVSIVTYAGTDETLLDGVSGENKALIMSVIESLEAGGVTYGSGGILAAYNCAERNFIRGGINRVILATDGDFNVGVTSEGELSRLIGEKRDTGVFLSILGYGMGNYKDNKMETLAKDGHGNAYYIDSLLEAQRVLIEEMGATLNTIAKDVKLQVEFNPDAVKAYRLLGYENRMLNAQDFNDDSVHAGAIGSGHSVTALYEIIPAGSDEEIAGIDLKYQERITTPSDELLNIAVRYKLPDGDESARIDHPVTLAELSATPSDNMLWASAVAELALSLRQATFAPGASIRGALELARSADYRSDPYRAELVQMMEFLAKSADL